MQGCIAARRIIRARNLLIWRPAFNLNTSEVIINQDYNVKSRERLIILKKIYIKPSSCKGLQRRRVNNKTTLVGVKVIIAAFAATSPVLYSSSNSYSRKLAIPSVFVARDLIRQVYI